MTTETQEPQEKKPKLLGLIPLDWRLDLTAIKPIRRLFKSRWFPLLAIMVNLFIFVIILLSGIVGGLSSGNYSFGIMFVWILWWVLLMMLLVPGLSRTWCMVCPLPTVGEWLQRLRILGVGEGGLGMNWKWPRRLSNMWLMNILFLATTFFSGFFTVKPLATFILLGGIIVLAIILSLLFEKRSFCLYVCPVSGFQGLYANMAMTEIRVKDPEICRKHKIKTCEVGNKNGYGCPWLLKPHELNRNTYCGMCLECFKTCPFDNMAMKVRPPGTDLLVNSKRGLDEAWKGFIMLGIAVMFYVAMMGRWGFLKDWVRAETLEGWLKFAGIHAVMNLLLIPAVFFVFALLSKLASGARETSLRSVFVNLSYSLIPMGLAAWVAFSFGFLLPNGSYLLHVVSDPFAWGWDLFGTAGFPWTPVLTAWLVPLQFVSLFAGYLVSLDYGYKLACQTYIDKAAAIRGFLPLLAFLTLVVIFFGWLYGG
ncbi:MAG: 4Fe-4S binding protein [Planctomycetes bacterium]|nr:4Fe-4S binding protein [Planctomycetota bacterium]